MCWCRFFYNTEGTGQCNRVFNRFQIASCTGQPGPGDQGFVVVQHPHVGILRDGAGLAFMLKKRNQWQ